MILTTAGRNLLAKALTGKLLTFTKAMCGNGRLGTKDPLTLTNLISPKRELPIQSMRTSATGTAEVTVEMTNKGLTTGFFVYEYGLFAKDPDTQQEVLYSYSYTDNPNYLEGDNGIDIINHILTIVTVIDQAPNIQATITSSNNYVTITRLDARIQDLFADSSDVSGFWTYAKNDTQRFRPSTVSQARNVLIGTYDIANLTSRIERLEDTLSQTLLALEMQNIFPGYTHFIIEDFNVVNQIDMFSARITSIVAGDDSIDCDPIDGMLPGSWYTITDGINFERVQVESISLENGIQRVILKDTIKNTYKLSSTQILRTSAQINPNIALGPSATNSVSWTPDLVWRGLSDSSTYTIKIDTSAGNSKAYSMSGNAVCDSSGYITLG